jgi:hypothetical protein
MTVDPPQQVVGDNEETQHPCQLVSVRAIVLEPAGEESVPLPRAGDLGWRGRPRSLRSRFLTYEVANKAMHTRLGESRIKLNSHFINNMGISENHSRRF